MPPQLLCILAQLAIQVLHTLLSSILISLLLQKLHLISPESKGCCLCVKFDSS